MPAISEPLTERFGPVTASAALLLDTEGTGEAVAVVGAAELLGALLDEDGVAVAAAEWLDRHAGVSDRAGTLLFAAAFFVFLNLHHYLIDATIWPSKGELVKAMVRKPAAVPAGEQAPSRAAARIPA